MLNSTTPFLKLRWAVYRNNLLWTRVTNIVTARRIVGELKAQGFYATFMELRDTSSANMGVK